MPHCFESFFRAVLAILTGALLTTGGRVPWWRPTRSRTTIGTTAARFTTNSDTYADGFCAYGCSQMGHSQYKLVQVDEDSDPEDLALLVPRLKSGAPRVPGPAFTGRAPRRILPGVGVLAPYRSAREGSPEVQETCA